MTPPVVVSPSRFLRLGLKDFFEDTFNLNLAYICAQFDVPWFELNFSHAGVRGSKQNFYEGERTLESLGSHEGPDLPAMAFWIAEGGDQNREMRRTFSGTVGAQWRFFLLLPEGLRPRLQDLREAVEAAMIATLESDKMPDNLGYRGDLQWLDPQEQFWVDRAEHDLGWVMQLDFKAGFEVNL